MSLGCTGALASLATYWLCHCVVTIRPIYRLRVILSLKKLLLLLFPDMRLTDLIIIRALILFIQTLALYKSFTYLLAYLLT